MIKESLKNKLLMMSLDEPPYLTVKEVTTCNGSASVNIRKGKRICVFEFELKLTVKVEGKEAFIEIEDFT